VQDACVLAPGPREAPAPLGEASLLAVGEGASVFEHEGDAVSPADVREHGELSRDERDALGRLSVLVGRDRVGWLQGWLSCAT
jgi:hypothetical protein